IGRFVTYRQRFRLCSEPHEPARRTECPAPQRPTRSASTPSCGWALDRTRGPHRHRVDQGGRLRPDRDPPAGPLVGRREEHAAAAGGAPAREERLVGADPRDRRQQRGPGRGGPGPTSTSTWTPTTCTSTTPTC